MKKPNLLLPGIAIVCALAACSSPEPPAAATAPEPPTEPVEPAQPPEPPPTVSSVPPIKPLGEAERAEPIVATTDCNLEAVDGQSFSGAEITLSIPQQGKASGWLRPQIAGTAIEAPVLRFESADKSQVWEVPLQLAIAREDLPSVEATAATPGFEVAFDASALTSGRYHLYIAYRSAGTLMGCDNGRWISVL